DASRWRPSAARYTPRFTRLPLKVVRRSPSSWPAPESGSRSAARKRAALVERSWVSCSGMPTSSTVSARSAMKRAGGPATQGWWWRLPRRPTDCHHPCAHQRRAIDTPLGLAPHGCALQPGGWSHRSTMGRPGPEPVAGRVLVAVQYQPAGGADRGGGGTARLVFTRAPPPLQSWRGGARAPPPPPPPP